MVAAETRRDGRVARRGSFRLASRRLQPVANGKGLDHLVDSVGAQLVGIYFQALGH